MAKVGRPRNLNSPEQLYELFENYKSYVKANPRLKIIHGGKDFEERVEPFEADEYDWNILWIEGSDWVDEQIVDKAIETDFDIKSIFY